MKQKIILFGLGPHSKRIYINGLKRLFLSPTIIVDLESNRYEIESFVKENSLTSELFFIPDAERDVSTVLEETRFKLDQLIN